MGRKKISDGSSPGDKRMNFSSRGVYTEKKKCPWCGHHKVLTGSGKTRCAKCRREVRQNGSEGSE